MLVHLSAPTRAREPGRRIPRSMTSPGSHLSHPKYRADIDGLRAAAVIAVVMFHAFPSTLSGGFLGVDVFFVISGFLISTIIFGSLERRAFSFTEFYARRARRIFPALLIVLVAVYAFGWFALVDAEYKQLGKHVAGAAAFVANVVFWREAGYFDTTASAKPLLHLWSLGIEEQFHLLWPMLAWTARKRPRHLLILTALLAVVSFGINVVTVKTNSVAAFYLPHTRIWELLCGSLLAWLSLRGSAGAASSIAGAAPSIHVTGGIAHLPSIAGALLLAGGIWRINQELSFPGIWALVPVAGTLLLIAAGPSAVINRTLCSWRPMVWIGLISYPLYLWHWPLLSFARIVESGEPGLACRSPPPCSPWASPATRRTRTTDSTFGRTRTSADSPATSAT
jgi:peptidoglycan/LPS O-acetylase OafA/YrhL